MQLFYTDHIIEGMARLPEEESQHIIKVLRKRNGDTIHITDGMGTLYEGTIYEAASHECMVNLKLLGVHRDDTPQLTIAIAPTKNRDRFEWFIEKAVELGCTNIQPLWCEHSERNHARTDRWDKIALSAMKQSLHLYKPNIAAPVEFRDFIAQAGGNDRFFGWIDETTEASSFVSAYRAGVPTVIAIGPEGDFSEDEAALAIAAGWKAVNLGDYRLRTETAGVAAMAFAHAMHQLATEREASQAGS
jgi:16S rRNA (uracil1498-N3)-methyltransferase